MAVRNVPQHCYTQSLTEEEQDILTNAIYNLPADRLEGITKVLQDANYIRGDEDEIDMDLDQLHPHTQRLLQQYVLSEMKPTEDEISDTVLRHQPETGPT